MCVFTGAKNECFVSMTVRVAVAAHYLLLMKESRSFNLQTQSNK